MLTLITIIGLAVLGYVIIVLIGVVVNFIVISSVHKMMRETDDMLRDFEKEKKK